MEFPLYRRNQTAVQALAKKQAAGQGKGFWRGSRGRNVRLPEAYNNEEFQKWILEERRKNFRARESFDSERLDSVERLVLDGKTAREIALEIGIAQNTATRYRRELVRRGRLPKSVLNMGSKSE